ncbi:MAG: CsbD family protein [Anaerolineae bacterium]|nr:CsbD family protein [Anaerolineae bacterium]
MNKDIFEGKWKQVRGQAKEWWGKLTDDDLERVGGKYEQFIGTIQEKYGYTRERAEEEINKRLAEHEVHEKEAELSMRAAEHDANPPASALPVA